MSTCLQPDRQKDTQTDRDKEKQTSDNADANAATSGAHTSDVSPLVDSWIIHLGTVQTYTPPVTINMLNQPIRTALVAVLIHG